MDAKQAKTNTLKSQSTVSSIKENKELLTLTNHIDSLIEESSLKGCIYIIYDISYDKCPFGIRFKDGYAQYLINHYRDKGFSFYTIGLNIHISW